MLLFVLASILAFIWGTTYFTNSGIGVGKGTLTRRDAAILEITTVTDALLVVCDGSRTDNLCYDGPTGFSYGPSEMLYYLDLDTLRGPHVLLPWVQRPAIWSGPYIFVPLWIPIVACLVLGLVLRRWPGRPIGVCVKCSYSLAGLPSGAACPECGHRA
jgi:hypothetical protein